MFVNSQKKIVNTMKKNYENIDHIHKIYEKQSFIVRFMVKQ